jgi:hypothetical protein
MVILNLCAFNTFHECSAELSNLTSEAFDGIRIFSPGGRDLRPSEARARRGESAGEAGRKWLARLSSLTSNKTFNLNATPRKPPTSATNFPFEFSLSCTSVLQFLTSSQFYCRHEPIDLTSKPGNPLGSIHPASAHLSRPNRISQNLNTWL